MDQIYTHTLIVKCNLLWWFSNSQSNAYFKKCIFLITKPWQQSEWSLMSRWKQQQRCWFHSFQTWTCSGSNKLLFSSISWCFWLHNHINDVLCDCWTWSEILFKFPGEPQSFLKCFALSRHCLPALPRLCSHGRPFRRGLTVGMSNKIQRWRLTRNLKHVPWS